MVLEELHPALKGIIPIIEGIAKTFGKNCEVVLHDIHNPQNSIIAIANGHVTGRTVGGPMSEYGLSAIRKGEYDTNKVNFLKKTSDGRILKSSSLFIKDENGKVIGFLCINFDISEFSIVKNLLNDFISVSDGMLIENSSEESFGSNINDVLNSIVNRTLDSLGKPVAFMSKDEKVNIVELLDEKGVFLIKGAIDYVAKVLCVSRYTIYNYLDEIRVNQQ